MESATAVSHLAPSLHMPDRDDHDNEHLERRSEDRLALLLGELGRAQRDSTAQISGQLVALREEVREGARAGGDLAKAVAELAIEHRHTREMATEAKDLAEELREALRREVQALQLQGAVSGTKLALISTLGGLVAAGVVTALLRVLVHP